MDKVILVNKLARLAMDEDYRLRLINGVAAKAIKYRAMNDAAILRIRKQR
jgi:malate synthase